MTPRNYGRVLLIASIAGKDGNAVRNVPECSLAHVARA